MKAFLKLVVGLVIAIPGGLALLTQYIGPEVLPLAPWLNRIVLGYDKFSAGIWSKIVGEKIAVQQGAHSFLTFSACLFIPAFFYLICSVARQGLQPSGAFNTETIGWSVLSLFSSFILFSAFMPHYMAVFSILAIVTSIAVMVKLVVMNQLGGWNSLVQFLNPPGKTEGWMARLMPAVFLVGITSLVVQILLEMPSIPSGKSPFIILLCLEYVTIMAASFRGYRLPFFIACIGIGPFLYRWLQNDVSPTVEGFLKSLGV